MKYGDIEDAFHLTSAPEGLPFVILHRHTGQVLCDHDGIGEYDIEMARDQGVDVDGPDWVAVPGKRELDLGRKLAIDFAAEHLSSEDFDRVQGIFSRSVAQWRFGERDYQNKLEAWHDFEAAGTEKALREWCAEHKILLED